MWKFPFFRKNDRDKKRRGGIGIEILIGVAAMGMVITFAASQGAETQRSAQAAGLAHQLNTASKGAQHYLDSNAASILEELNKPGVNNLLISRNNVRVNGGNVLNAPDGDTSGMYGGLSNYMPVTFNNTSFKQDVQMYAYKGRDGAVHAIFGTTGGVPHTGDEEDSQYRNYEGIARKVSSMTGFGLAMDKDANGNNIAPVVVGQKNSWRFHFGDADQGNVPAFDHLQLARPLYAYSAAVKDDMLYRVAIDGHPELNAMGTDLSMSGYKINDSGTIVISQRPKIPGTDDYAEVPEGGNGLRIEPYLIAHTGTGREVHTGEEINAAADVVCDNNSDGHIFTIGYQVDESQRQSAEDMSGIWMCMGGVPRQISDSGNSSMVKSTRILSHGETIQKPYCPRGTSPSIYLAEANFAERQTQPRALVAVQTYATDLGEKWQVNVRIKTTGHAKGNAATANAWTVPAKNDKLNYVVAHTTCERDLDIVE